MADASGGPPVPTVAASHLQRLKPSGCVAWARDIIRGTHAACPSPSLEKWIYSPKISTMKLKANRFHARERLNKRKRRQELGEEWRALRALEERKRRAAAGASGRARHAELEKQRRAAAGARGRARDTSQKKARRAAQGDEGRAARANKEKERRQRNRCPHGGQKYYCKRCGGKGLCPHGKRLPAGKKTCTHCPHGVVNQGYLCKLCGGAGLCHAHKKPKTTCAECRAERVSLAQECEDRQNMLDAQSNAFRKYRCQEIQAGRRPPSAASELYYEWEQTWESTVWCPQLMKHPDGLWDGTAKRKKNPDPKGCGYVYVSNKVSARSLLQRRYANSIGFMPTSRVAGFKHNMTDDTQAVASGRWGPDWRRHCGTPVQTLLSKISERLK